MAEEDIEVPSAVMIPDGPEETATPPSNALKRRASSGSSSSSKRARIHVRDNEADKERTATARRGLEDADERKRGKRLFGGLLGTLSQNSASSIQKRRTDIDRKQREKLRTQAGQDHESGEQRLEKLKAARKAEQVLWDRQALKTKHENNHALARFLQTHTQPVLYYKPWKLRPDEEILIRQQIVDVERKSEANLPSDGLPGQTLTGDVEMETEPDSQPNNVGTLPLPADQSGAAEESPLVHDQNSKGVQGNKAANSPVAVKPQAPSEALRDHMDETGEDVFQGEEDAVLY